MDEGGAGLSLSEAPRSTRGSVRLALVLRSVLVSPRVGFQSALTAARRRERVGQTRTEGMAPFVLTALGGAALMLLWLKLAGMIELRSVGRSDYSDGFLALALAAGAVFAIVAQIVSAAPAARASRVLGGGGRSVDLRIVWGTAAFPQVFVLLILLPLDLLIAGPQTFTTEPMVDSLATAWAALSIALQVAITLWSLLLYVFGVEVATGLGKLKAGLVVTVAGLGLALVCGSVIAPAAVAAGAL